MVQIIAGEKGKGKTKHLISKVNEDIKTSTGTIVYLDKSTKHMFELHNKIRLINATDYFIESADGFLGFLCGIISQDHDLEKMYLDSFLTLANLDYSDSEKLSDIIHRLDKISEAYQTDFVISISADADKLPDNIKQNIILSL